MNTDTIKTKQDTFTTHGLHVPQQHLRHARCQCHATKRMKGHMMHGRRMPLEFGHRVRNVYTHSERERERAATPMPGHRERDARFGKRRRRRTELIDADGGVLQANENLLATMGVPCHGRTADADARHEPVPTALTTTTLLGVQGEAGKMGRVRRAVA